jgi:hypothetical protein
MSKVNPPNEIEMLAEIDRRSLFAAQQLVNGWHRQFGADSVKAAQDELDRRRRKLIANEPGAAAAEVAIESRWDRCKSGE